MKILPNIVLFILLMLMLIGCTTIKYVPVESVHTDSIYISKVQVDSVYLHDSTIIRQVGDTIYHTEIKYKYKFKFLCDTFTDIQVDTITQVVEIEKPLTKWEQTKMELGGVAIGGVIFAIIALIVFILFKLR
jgi:hypothetical protein